MRQYLEPIWHVRGQVALPPEAAGSVFERLAPLFDQPGTSVEQDGDRLRFAKRDPVAQDRMAVFETGELQVTTGSEGPALHYHLVSRALLFCFLAPLLFLGFAGLAATLYPDAPAEKKAEKPEAKPPRPLHPIDQWLGAPAPEKPGARKDGKEEGGGKRGKKPSPTPGYVFAGLFAALYAIGRVLEARLVNRLFQRQLQAG